MPTGEAPISETATSRSATDKSGPAKPGDADGAKKTPRRFRPMAFVKATVKNAPWVVIAVVLHVIIIAVLSIMYVQTHKKGDDTPPTAINIGKNKPEDEKEPEVTQEIIDRSAIPKAQNVDAVLEGADELTVDTPLTSSDSDSTATSDTGGPDTNASGGTSISVGNGPGHAGSGKPSAFVTRKLGTGDGTRGKDSTARTTKAVKDGLVWLVRHQQPDGSWSASKLHEVCDKDAPCDGGVKNEDAAQYDEGLTGLSLLAFLGYGADHTYKVRVKDNRGRETRLGEVVKNGLLWLIKRQDAHKDGRFTDDGQVYNEALATLAMCEAYGMSQHEKWKGPAQRGIDFLVQAQRISPSGTGLWGWRYEPRGWIEGPEGKAAYPDEKEWKLRQHWSDISATTWVVMALKSAELAGLNVPEESMKGAMDFTKFVTVKDGRVAYMDPLQVGRKIAGEGDQFAFHPATLDALGMCVRTFVEKNIDDPVLELSAKQLLLDLPSVAGRDKDGKESKDAKDKLGVDYYYWYYGSLAMNQLDGPDSPKRTTPSKFWKPWNSALTEALLPLQTPAEKTPKTCAEGGWNAPDRWSYAGGPIYRTAINVLTLEVYYRYENAFGATAIKKPK